MQKERTSRQTHNSQNAVQSLRQHALNFATHKTGSRQIEIRERQHVAFDAAFFLFVERHDHEHGDERAGGCGNDVHSRTLEFRCRIHDVQSDPQNTPASEGNTEEPVSQSFLAPAFLPEHDGDTYVQYRSGNEHGNRNCARSV